MYLLMEDVKTAINDFMEELTYKPYNNFTYNYRVEQVADNEYEVYIVNSFATIIYSFADVREEDYELEEHNYSAIVDFISCKITPFEADSDTLYYLDGLNRYIEDCELVSKILDSVDVYLDREKRTYFG